VLAPWPCQPLTLPPIKWIAGCLGLSAMHAACGACARVWKLASRNGICALVQSGVGSAADGVKGSIVCWDGALLPPHSHSSSSQSFLSIGMMLPRVMMVRGPLAFTCIGSLECTAPNTSQPGSGWALLRSGVGTCCATNSFLMSSSASSFSPLLVKMGVDPCGFRSLAVS
jgi:hypothetical protein